MLPSGHCSHHVATVMPNCDSQSSIGGALSASHFYLAHMTVDAIINPSFINSNIRGAEFYAVSAAPHDRSCSVIVRDGRLILELDAENHETFGMIGRKNSSNRYEVTVGLLEPSFVPGATQYDRLLWCLSQRTTALHFLMGRTMDGQSTEVVFPDDTRVQRIPLESVNCSSEADWPQIPDLPPAGKNQAWKAFGVGFLEWLGAVLCNASSVANYAAHDEDNDGDDRFVDDYCSQLQMGEHPSDHGEILKQEWVGLIPHTLVQGCIKDVKQAVASEIVPWGAVVTWGFQGNDPEKLHRPRVKPHTVLLIFREASYMSEDDGDGDADGNHDGNDGKGVSRGSLRQVLYEFTA